MWWHGLHDLEVSAWNSGMALSWHLLLFLASVSRCILVHLRSSWLSHLCLIHHGLHYTQHDPFPTGKWKLEKSFLKYQVLLETNDQGHLLFNFSVIACPLYWILLTVALSVGASLYHTQGKCSTTEPPWQPSSTDSFSFKRFVLTRDSEVPDSLQSLSGKLVKTAQCIKLKPDISLSLQAEGLYDPS